MRSFGLLFLLIWMSSSAVFAFECLDFVTLSETNSLRPSLNELDENLYLVHGTNRLSESTIHGRQNVRNPFSPLPVVRFIPTIHFSMGELVRPHVVHMNKATWEQRKYGLIVPLKLAKRNLINLNPYDTIFLGEFEIPFEAIWVVPTLDKHRVRPGQRYVTYNPNLETLRTAVDRVIEQEGGWKITMDESANGVARISGQAISPRDFFAPLLREHPHLSIGNHLFSDHGWAYRFGLIENFLKFATSGFNKELPPAHPTDRQFFMRLVERELLRVQSDVTLEHFSPKALKVLDNAIAQTNRWINMAKLELELNAKGLTLTKSNPETWLALFQNPLNSRTKDGFFEIEPSNRIEVRYVASLMSALPRAEVEHIVADFSGYFRDLDIDLFWFYYSLSRTLDVDLVKSKSEGLPKIIRTFLKNASSRSDSSEIAPTILDLMERQFLRETRNDSIALNILSMPSSRQFFQREMGLTFKPGPLTLEDFMRVHPSTSLYFSFTTASQRGSLPWNLVQMITRFEEPQSKPVDKLSFRLVRSSANEAKILSKLWSDYMEQLTWSLNELDPALPPRGLWLTIHNMIYRGEFGELSEIFSRLGVPEMVFRSRFPRDSDFWNSSLSIIEIYQEFKGN